MLRLPKLGQSMEAATIVRWHAAEGTKVAKGEVVVSIETEKATYELEAPGDGWLHIEVPEGEEVAVETVLGRLLSEPGAPVATPSPATAAAAAPSPAPVASPAKGARPGRVLATPKAKRLAAELGVDLAMVRASGADGIISAEDVEAAARAVTGAAAPQGEPATAGARRETRRERLAGARRTMARRLQQAWQEIPHIVQMVDADASGLLARRSALRAEGIEVSVNDLVLQAAAQALAETPALNVSLEGGELIYHDGVDVGFAVETERGLYVPVVRGADSLTPGALAAETARLSAAARDGTMRPDEMGGASLTVSNLGMYGIRAGTPVINPGEPVLVFVGTIEERAVVAGGQVVARPTLTLSIAYDHRLASGAGAAAYTQALKGRIEEGPAAGAAAAAPAAPGEPRQLRAASAGDAYRIDVHGPEGHRWTLDEPPAQGGTGEGPTPVDAFLGGLLGCLMVSLKAAARRRKVPLARVGGEVRANPERAIREIGVVLQVWSDAPEADVQALLAPAERGCWVSGVLKPEIDYHVELQVLRPGEERM